MNTTGQDEVSFSDAKIFESLELEMELWMQNSLACVVMVESKFLKSWNWNIAISVLMSFLLRYFVDVNWQVLKELVLKGQ